MRSIKKSVVFLLALAASCVLWKCGKADSEYVHTTNTISQLICQASHTGTEFLGEINEYDKDGNLITGSFKQEDIEGGYGLILFKIPQSFANDVPLDNVYLKATVTYDVFISPSLSGRHDISGDGILITVTSGVGTKREYRIRGVYE